MLTMSYKAIHFTLMEYEKKLHEVMGDYEFKKFASGIAKQAFKIDVEDLPDGDFKKFALKNFDRITMNTLTEILNSDTI